MADFENEYLLFRNELILKYGEETLRTAMNKAGAILLLSSSFKFVPNNAHFDEEISILDNIRENMKKKPIKEDFSAVQEAFRNNRLSEIVKENKDTDYFSNAKCKTIEEKIFKAETMGLVSTSMTDKKVSTGHSIGELISDLYILYVKEYKLFRQNPQHPIFLKAVLNNSDFSALIQQPTIGTGGNKGGCLGVALFIISLSSLIFFM